MEAALGFIVLGGFFRRVLPLAVFRAVLMGAFPLPDQTELAVALRPFALVLSHQQLPQYWVGTTLR